LDFENDLLVSIENPQESILQIVSFFA